MRPGDLTIRTLSRCELRRATLLKREALTDTFIPRAPKLERLFRWKNQTALKTSWPVGATIGAFKNDNLVGVAAYKVRRKFLDKVSDVWVAQADRRQGIGGGLLGQAEAALRRKGTRIARLTTPRFNASAIAFYIAHGWRIESFTLHRTLFYTAVQFKKRLSG